jgi:hypothetical protein
MTAKLLFFHEFASAGAASRTRANEYLRQAAGQPASRAPAAAKYIPKLRPRLECRWKRPRNRRFARRLAASARRSRR